SRAIQRNRAALPPGPASGVRAAWAALLLACALAAQAQQWPAKPVRIVVAYPPGGGIDVLGRQLADKLTPQWRQPVVVENKPGAQPALSGEMLKHRAGIDLVHVPYKGISLAVPAVMAGEVQLTFAGIASSIGPLRAGRIKPIAIGGQARSPLLPEVPTFSELGF